MKLRHLFTYDFSPGKIYKIPDAPASILWDICYLCNQRCTFCYNPNENFKKSLPDFDLTRHIAEKICRWGVKELLYLGGEPTIHPRLWEIIKLVHGYGVEQKLISNGAFIDQTMAKLFARFDIETGISLHGSDRGAHDEITRTPGSFDKALEAISILEGANARWYLQYTPIIGEKSFFNSISILKKRFPSLNRIDVNRLIPKGCGTDTAKNYQNQESLWKCLSDIPKIMSLGIQVSVGSIPHCWIKKNGVKSDTPAECVSEILQSIRPCYMAINQVAMDDQGRFKLCSGGTACTESILKTPPEDLWKNAAPFVQRRDFSFLPRSCIDFSKGTACRNFYQCGGGCKIFSDFRCPSHSKSDF